MTLYSVLSKASGLWLLLSCFWLHAAGVVPDTSVVVIEESDGEGAINVRNTDGWPVLLLSAIEDLPQDTEKLLVITPPAARVEGGKSQRVRFVLTNQTALKTERLKRVTFEGVPPKEKGKNQVRVVVRQNLPLLIRPKGLARDPEPWKKLVWKMQDGKLVVSNPSAYVVRLAQSVQTLPDKTGWVLPQAYVLPGETLTLSTKSGRLTGKTISQVRIAPATTWGFGVESWDAPLSH